MQRWEGMGREESQVGRQNLPLREKRWRCCLTGWMICERFGQLKGITTPNKTNKCTGSRGQR